MGADDVELRLPLGVELGEATVVVAHLGVVERDGSLLDIQDGGHAGPAIEGAVVVEGIPGVEDPAVTCLDRDRRVAASVAWHWDEHYTRVDLGQLLGCGEASPRLPCGLVRDQLGAMGELGGVVAAPLGEGWVPP